MSFSPEQFVDKLQQLHDSQDSISTSAKWLLSQYRDSEAIAETWKRYVTQKKLPERKRLLAVYLVNHVVQQGRSQGIEQFQKAFAKVLIDTLPMVSLQFPSELQGKLKRVVTIWKQRKVFDPASLQQIELNLNKAISSSSTSSSSKSNGSKSNRTDLNVPSNIQPIVSLYQKLNKNKHNIPALKSRFDNAINDLDINSLVYEENFQTVTKIAKVTQDTIKESMGNRNELIECLQTLLNQEVKSLDQDRVLLNEIEFSLDSKDPVKIANNGGVNNDDDVLPSYGGNDSDSDSDSDNDNDDGRKSDDSNANSDDEVTVMPKRQLDGGSEEEELNKQKKMKPANPEEEEEEYIVDGGDDDDNALETHDTGNTESTVTSSIQDLLSRLAN
ncbi:regulator of Ty1 transposition protein 103 [Monosporozyma servazzii]